LYSAFLSVNCAFAQSADGVEFFEKNIRPIIATRCQICHNDKVKTGGLDLQTTEGLRAAHAGGFFTPAANPEQSLLLKALGFEGRIKMPPQGKLAADKIAVFEQWIRQGAPFPDSGSAAPVRSAGMKITDEDRRYWAFRPLAKTAAPVGNPVDFFLDGRLQREGLKAAPPAGKLTLLRRVTYDLTGLPPTPGEIRDFLDDNSPGAFSKVAERLLASPRYGERWGRHWLDVVRYADSTGSDEDHRYPHAWRYRDYVIKAFNDDMPYSQFVREQLAGDILAADPGSGVGSRGIVATGFLALGKKALAQRDLVLKRYDVIDDQIDVTSKALLGLTVACARCHDHKFDPISTRDYYALAGIFASTYSYDGGAKGRPVETPLVPEERYKDFRKHWNAIQDLETKIDKILDLDRDAKRHRDKYHARMADYMMAAHEIYARNQPPAETAAKAKLEAGMLDRWVFYLRGRGRPELGKWHQASDDSRARIAEHYQIEFKQAADQYDRNLNWWTNARRRYPESGKLVGPRPAVRREDNPFFYAVWLDGGPLHRTPEQQIEALEGEKAKSIRTLLAEQAELERSAPSEEIPMACAVTEGEPVDQKIFVRGDHHTPGAPAPRAFPEVLTGGAQPAPFASRSGRLELADWIVSEKNPIAARVMVNRVWQWHFGEGIVRTPDNFGKLGEKPTHPELLDYLARRFIDDGWSVKKLHRLILESNAYRMSAAVSLEQKSKDPENHLLSRFPKRRLSIEEIRDSLLAIGGQLDFTMGGTLDPGIGTDGETSPDRISMNPDTTNRRSVYLPLRRSNLPALLNLFDFGDATSPQGKRGATTVATQALFLMNSPFVERQAEGLAGRLASEEKEVWRVEQAYLAILSRSPKPDEIDEAVSYVHGLSSRWGDKIGSRQAWRSFCQMLMASNEFIYVY
jgi:cytochrome c553